MVEATDVKNGWRDVEKSTKRVVGIDCKKVDAVRVEFVSIEELNCRRFGAERVVGIDCKRVEAVSTSGSR